MPSWNDHVGSINGKKCVVISEGCFGGSVSFFDTKTGEKTGHEYVSNSVTIEEIKSDIEKKVDEYVKHNQKDRK